ncbi:MAG: RagB/SusD family nutrient uptake outer membrane protein [Prevotellaceae bacterium]|nr:RagB/SusD family nutrient uptake outer membrane protein [Prevotellaceae bacterium]
MRGKSIIKLLAATLIFCHVSCNEFLDELPDNRTELDSKEKIAWLLTSAYSNSLFLFTAEMSSDNYDDFGETYSTMGRLQEELFHWEAVTDDGDESPKQVWGGYYSAIAHANQALQAIAQLGNPPDLDAQRGEALMCRAYHHFILVNVFCKHFSELTGHIDLGIPYVEQPETVTAPHYERGTVVEVYEKIERDLEEALPLIDDAVYTVPKYHFNRAAAYAFATRFYLYYRKYDKVIEYAGEVLGSNPAGMIRNTVIFSDMPDHDIIANEYIKPEHNANLLLMTGFSQMGVLFGPYGYGKRYMHSTKLSEAEVTADGPWGVTNPYFPMLTYSYGPFGFTSVGKLPYLFEYTDPVAQIGYPHTVLVALGSDEVLLNRAEAYVLQDNYDAAAADIGTWVRGHLKGATVPTRNDIHLFYNRLAYYTSTAPTVKKRLNPERPVMPRSEQESFLHCILHIRRIELLFEGLRWFDIKRYGIEITRREVNTTLQIIETDKLTLSDPRRAIQLPADVITAGLTPNPR